jgi:alginate O-acetyltransferase complex protein AlgI
MKGITFPKGFTIRSIRQMLFNSIEYAFFLPLVFIIYWSFSNSWKTQNLLLILFSYLFYAFWDWRFLSLIIISTFTDYHIGKKIFVSDHEKRRKILLWTSVGVNLSILFTFKYLNFFIYELKCAFSKIGIHTDLSTLNIILPIGISFYTFQTLSYTIDIYRKKIRPTNNLIVFSTFVCFFPQLVAGPIERAKKLIPQFENKRDFNVRNSNIGLFQIIWGLFKKVVVADNCAPIVNEIFSAGSNQSGIVILIGAFLFSFQIYCDFSGYSDIAIGTSKLFGIKLSKNFLTPYFSRNIAEFWKNWHISLSSWFKDYVYIPLGGSKKGKIITTKNILIVFFLSGLWHGSEWSFILWGILHALFLIIHKQLPPIKNRDFDSKIYRFISTACTFTLVTLAWIPFRGNDLSHIIDCYSNLFSMTLFTIPHQIIHNPTALVVLFFIFTLVTLEYLYNYWTIKMKKSPWDFPTPIKCSFFYSILISIYIYGNLGDNIEFIYFQF